jgi:SOS response regulatory protein OraA/RecX
MHIRNELNRRGISEALVEAKLTRSADFWIAVAQGAVRKRFRHVQTKEEEMIARKENEFMDDIDKSATVTSARDHWQRQARFLARRGFPADLIYRVLGGSGR